VANAERSQPPLVIKVGGSLAETGRLKDALHRIAAATRPVVVVPGGGQFADKVRDLQRAVGFDDAAAHRLAMLGMHQMAEVFMALEPRLKEAASVEAMHQTLGQGDIPLWVPLPMMERDTTITPGWETTSDSLAARLAELLGSPLALLKSVSVAPSASAVALSADGVVDRAFPAAIARSGLDWRIFGPDDDAAFEAYLRAAPAAPPKS
jgi:5-(aminomethyl)-3-furanmethanol phosphate kinase